LADSVGKAAFGPDFDWFVGRATTDFAHHPAEAVGQGVSDPHSDFAAHLTAAAAEDTARIGAPDYDPTYGELGPFVHSIFGTSLDFVGPSTTQFVHQPALDAAHTVDPLGDSLHI
jgi:hypothetical protein